MPSTQIAPQLGATVSLLSGQITAATTEDLRDANKALKFSKVHNDVGLQFRPLGEISNMVLVAMSDASWGIRREGHSQGGYPTSFWIGEVFVCPGYPEAL